MNATLVINALSLAAYLSLQVAAAALVGAVIAGILKAATQIEDQVIGFAAKLASVTVLGYFVADKFFAQILAFAVRVWGGMDFYN